MKYITLWLLIISVMTATTAIGDEIPRMDAAETMALSDKNEDERLDREEYHQRMTEVFFFADINKDGNLTITEIQVIEEIDPQQYEVADRDGNQTLSVYEYLYVLHYDFETADRDKDGTLDMEELRLMVEK